LMKSLSVEEIKTYLTKGALDEELMRVYGLSPEELRKLYDRFMKAIAEGSPYVQVSHDRD